jgi:ribosome-associated translation inhibitor RaiA
MKDRIPGLKDKIDINEKTEEYVEKRLKNWERNMQKPCDPSKNQTCQS